MFDDFFGLPLLIVLFFISGLLILIAAQKARRRRLQQQVLGLKWLKELKALISHVQKHRGLSNAYLNGSEKVMSTIEGLQSEMSRDVSRLSSLDDWVVEDLRWQNITEHLQKLTSNFAKLPVENNMMQHNQLIQSLLFFVDDVAQQYDLLLLKSQGVSLQIAWRETLRTAEYIGQARALGTGVAVLNHCDSVSRIRLNYLCRKIEENTATLWRQITPDQSQKDKVSELLHCIVEQTIKDKPDMDADGYFSLATTALDSLHDQYDTMIQTQLSQLQYA